MNLEALHERAVQRELVEVLLQPTSDTSCVLIHGMGGTGKTVTAVAAVQERAIRTHFAAIFWLSVGADAVGERIKQLQTMLYKMLTGKNVQNEGQDEQEHQALLVAAMAKRPRSLLVLDDPWMPEQVRSLNPIDEGAHTEHRLLITTRIRDLVPKATRVELPLMGKDEAVALLLALANIDKASYLKDHPSSTYPPEAAYTIAAECGLLPITLTIAAQVVRSWGEGWETAVLPLLREQEGSGGKSTTSTAEERVIGAGLKALERHKDGEAVKELFRMFAVTQEDFVHPIAVIELLWRSCCASESEKREGSLATRLKVRQWTQMLVDHSLLLGSSSEGVHLHDIVLQYLRKRLSPREMRVVQRKVVEGMIAASQARVAATGRGMQMTGSTAKAFAGEEVDWYCCNVGSHHVKQSLDPELSLVDNADLRALLLHEDEVLARQAAVAVGDEGLQVLGAHYMRSEMFFEAAKLKWTTASMKSLFTALGVALMEDALSLLRQDGGSRTAVQALELRVLMTLGWIMVKTSPKRPAVFSRIAELRKGNPTLPVDPWHVVLNEMFTPAVILTGQTAAAYDDPDNPVTDESRLKAFQLMSGEEALSLMEEAVAGAVGARKEVLELYKLAVSTIYYHVAQNTEEGVRVVPGTTSRILGDDCRLMMHAICSQRFERHFAVSRLVGSRIGALTNGYTSGLMPEKTGDIQMHVDVADIQNKWMLAYARASPAPGYELVGIFQRAGDRVGLELSPHYPKLSHDYLRVYASYGINKPSEFLEAYKTSAEYARNRQGARSSADGRHHRYHFHNIVALAGCIFGLTAEDMSTVEMDWLDALPPAQDSRTMHCINWSNCIMANARVLVAELLERAGRFADALEYAQAEIEDPENPTLPSKLQAGRVLGRCHAAMGERVLSVTAFESSIELSRLRHSLLSEALAVRGCALAAKAAGGSDHEHTTWEQRLVEVQGRMQGRGLGKLALSSPA